jgi:hypothetical protein
MVVAFLLVIQRSGQLPRGSRSLSRLSCYARQRVGICREEWRMVAAVGRQTSARAHLATPRDALSLAMHASIAACLARSRTR